MLLLDLQEQERQQSPICLNRFYDIQDGKIRYDGININKIKKADLRRSHGNRTAGYYTCLQRTVEGQYPLWKAWMLQTRRLLQQLNWPMQTVLSADCQTATIPCCTSNGANLSQGQRQLLVNCQGSCGRSTGTDSG